MRSFTTLLRREWLEGRSAYLYAPAVVLALILLAGLFTGLVDPVVEADNAEIDKPFVIPWS